METVIAAKLLEHEKSHFLIEIIEHSTKKRYVRVKQSILVDGLLSDSSEIKLNPELLDEFIGIMANYRTKLLSSYPKPYMSHEIQVKVIEAYLKGVPIKELTMRFNYKAAMIEEVLVKNNIKLISPAEAKPPKRRNRFGSNGPKNGTWWAD